MGKKTGNKKNTAKALAIAAASTGAAVGAAYVTVGNVIYNKFMSKKAINKQMLVNSENAMDNKYYPKYQEGLDWFKSMKPSKVKIVSPRGGYVHADFISAKEDSEHSDVWVILAHAYMGAPAHMGIYGEKFYEMGFNCIYPHLCGHGKSETNEVSLGWHDRIDVLGWIEYILNENPHAKIVLFGVSLGAATVMMTTGEDLADNVVCAIEDCGFTSAWDECRIQFKELIGLPLFPFLTSANTASKMRNKLDIKEASCIEQVKKSRTPTLFIHGDKDDFVPFWMQDTLYKAASCEKERLVIPGAAHGESAVVDPEKYFSTVKAFIEKYI